MRRRHEALPWRPPTAPRPLPGRVPCGEEAIDGARRLRVMDERLGQDGAERARRKISAQPRRQYHACALERARLSEEIECEQASVRIRRALDEEAPFRELRAQRR